MAKLFNIMVDAVVREWLRLLREEMVMEEEEMDEMMATLFDGITRHNPEGLWFRRHAQEHGFKAAIEWRDSGRPIPEGDEARTLIRHIDARAA